MTDIGIAALAAVAGIVAGICMALVYWHSAKQKLVVENELLKNTLDAQRKHSEEMRQAEATRYEELLRAEEIKSEELRRTEKIRSEELRRAEEERYKAMSDAQQQRFDEALEKVKEQMKNASDEMLKQRQKEFMESNGASMEQIVAPLKDTIDRMKTALNENSLKQTAMGGELKANIENMARISEAARKSADELSKALKHGSKVQGDWGETVLAELLDSQGFTRGVHYDVQAVLRNADGSTVRSADGSIMRPDIILHLDRNRDVIIDAKVSLTAFFDYVNADSEPDRRKFLKAHIDSLCSHVKELSAKDYSSYVQPPKIKMDYVIMFVPNTGALWTALNAQPDLWRKAMDKNVFIADEQTLYAALRIIALTWTQIAQAQNHQQLYDLAEEMLDRVGQFDKKYRAIGKALDAAKSAYEDGGRKFEKGGQSIIHTCDKLIKLGAKQSDRNPIPQLSAELPPDEID